LLNISDISNNLELKDGIWNSKSKSNVSYPDNGNDCCFRVEDNSFWFKHRNNCIVEIIKNFPPRSEIFDIGGGNGFVAAELERNGFKTILVDPGLNGVKNAEKRRLPNIICSTLEDAGFKPESISAVGLFDVLEHIREDLIFLKKIQTILINNGMLYLTVPAYSFLWSEEDNLSGHFRRYSKKTISLLLQSAGFKVEYCSFIFFPLPVPILLLRVIPYKFRFLTKENLIENIAKVHQPMNKYINNIAEKVLKFEPGWIRAKKKILFGGSILIAAVKK
jgi:SAM-dependent methyltransferase